KFKSDREGKYTGIGLELRRDPARDLIQVVTPIKDSPAYKAGIKTGDHILKVIREVDSDGKRLDKREVISGVGILVDEANQKIMGVPGTKVKVLVERAAEDKPLEFEITRAVVTYETVLGFI